MVDLSKYRALITKLGVCTVDPTHEVRCQDEELRHTVEHERCKLVVKLAQAENRVAELEAELAEGGES